MHIIYIMFLITHGKEKNNMNIVWGIIVGSIIIFVVGLIADAISRRYYEKKYENEEEFGEWGHFQNK